MFDIGQKIVCVNDNFINAVIKNTFYVNLPEKGKTYTVRDIIPAHNYNGGISANTCAVLLEEIVNPTNAHDIENGFSPTRFVPLEEIKMESKEAEYAYA